MEGTVDNCDPFRICITTRKRLPTMALIHHVAFLASPLPRVEKSQRTPDFVHQCPADSHGLLPWSRLRSFKCV